MSENTDYTVTEVRRAPSGHVTYLFTDRYGQRMHITVSFANSTAVFIDSAIRRMIVALRPQQVAP